MPIYNPPYVSSNDGGGGIIKKTAANQVNRFQAVVVDEAALVASNLISEHAAKKIGIALNNANLGDLVSIQTFGLIVNPLWNWLESQPILLGANGTLIQGKPLDGFVLILGFPEESDSFFFDAQIPLMRN